MGDKTKIEWSADLVDVPDRVRAARRIKTHMVKSQPINHLIFNSSSRFFCPYKKFSIFLGAITSLAAGHHVVGFCQSTTRYRDHMIPSFCPIITVCTKPIKILEYGQLCFNRDRIKAPPARCSELAFESAHGGIRVISLAGFLVQMRPADTLGNIGRWQPRQTTTTPRKAQHSLSSAFSYCGARCSSLRCSTIHADVAAAIKARSVDGECLNRLEYLAPAALLLTAGAAWNVLPIGLATVLRLVLFVFLHRAIIADLRSDGNVRVREFPA